MKFIMTKNEDYYQIDCYLANRNIGYINFKVLKESVWLNKIEVKKSYRRLGVGSKLLKLFENECFNHWKNCVEGKFYPEDEDGEKVKKFYTDNGYNVSKEGYDTEIFKNLVKRPDLDGIKMEEKNNISR